MEYDTSGNGSDESTCFTFFFFHTTVVFVGVLVGVPSDPAVFSFHSAVSLLSLLACVALFVCVCVCVLSVSVSLPSLALALSLSLLFHCQKPKSIQAIEESNHKIQQAEEQLEKDLAELAAIMAEHDGNTQQRAGT